MTDTELKTVKFQMMLTPSEVERLDNFRFENRLKSRAEAIRLLFTNRLTDYEVRKREPNQSSTYKNYGTQHQSCNRYGIKNDDAV